MKHLEPKRWGTLLLSFCRLALGWGTPLTLSQVAYHSMLAVTSCLCRAQRSARDASLRYSQVFCEHMSGPGHVRCILNSPVNVGTIQSLYSPQGSSSAVFSFPDFWVGFPFPHFLSLTPGSYGQHIFKYFSIDVT